jgi:hypothetical protein
VRKFQEFVLLQLESLPLTNQSPSLVYFQIIDDLWKLGFDIYLLLQKYNTTLIRPDFLFIACNILVSPSLLNIYLQHHSEESFVLDCFNSSFLLGPLMNRDQKLCMHILFNSLQRTLCTNTTNSDIPETKPIQNEFKKQDYSLKRPRNEPTIEKESNFKRRKVDQTTFILAPSAKEKEKEKQHVQHVKQTKQKETTSTNELQSPISLIPVSRLLSMNDVEQLLLKSIGPSFSSSSSSFSSSSSSFSSSSSSFSSSSSSSSLQNSKRKIDLKALATTDSLIPIKEEEEEEKKEKEDEKERKRAIQDLQKILQKEKDRQFKKQLEHEVIFRNFLKKNATKTESKGNISPQDTDDNNEF